MGTTNMTAKEEKQIKWEVIKDITDPQTDISRLSMTIPAGSILEAPYIIHGMQADGVLIIKGSSFPIIVPKHLYEELLRQYPDYLKQI